MQADPGQSARPTWWRPILTVAAFSALPFAVFLNDNRAEAEPEAALLLYTLILLALGLTVVAAVDRLRGPDARERAAVVFAVAAFLFFHFEVGREVAELLGFSAEAGAPALAAWLLVGVGAAVAAVRLSKHPLAWSYTVVVGALLLALPLIQYSHFRATEDAAARPASDARFDELSTPAGRLPDVYFFLMDGYGRADQVEAAVGHDNAPFLRALRRRGFTVHGRAAAAYPVTFLSLASTLEMDYPAPPGELGEYGPYFGAIEGDNATVRAFDGLGYRFAFATDYSSLECGEAVDLCIEPQRDLVERLIGEREHAILQATPLAEVLPAVGINFSPLSGTLSPENVVDAVRRRRSVAPVFAYSHILDPHPPYRYLDGCEEKDDLTEPSLIYWGERDGAGGDAYRQAIECVNRRLLESVDVILAEDPDAIIVIQGDHGPKFGIDFHRPLSEWSGAELRQRFPILNAQRLPGECSSLNPRAGLAVNTFRYVLSCITGQRANPLRPRHFMVDLEAGRIERISALPDSQG